MRNTQTPAQRVSVFWGDSLKKARTNAGLTQVQLAARTHDSQTTISRFERGGIPWTPEAMLRFAAALDTEVDQLFRWPVGITDMERYRQEVAAA